MGFAETRAGGNRRILEAAGIGQITLAGTVFAGDCVGIDTATWVLSAHTSGEEPLLVALTAGYSGDVIDVAVMAVIEVTTTSTNTSTVGELVSLNDSGEYVVDTGSFPDVGFVAAKTATKTTLVVCPLAPQLTVVRS